MSEHVNGTNRDQTVLFPNTIDQYVEKENPVRFIDAFVDSLNLESLVSSTQYWLTQENLPTTLQIC
jgi:hypothetical protein